MADSGFKTSSVCEEKNPNKTNSNIVAGFPW